MDLRKARDELRLGRSIFDLSLRVTFYARVSTDKDEQLNSLENQVQYYTELIQSKPCWTYVEGYIDEGISGTSTKNRAAFNRMIADAKTGRFDFILTKEISRFSRSTLDSILYTQELLEHNVGVLFQNDNINTLDPDSEFRLVVMAGVAQDEVRKLSERLKFGYRQSIKNGHVLGNDSLWGYEKKDCRLTVREDEARIVRRIFDLYANYNLGVRRISQLLFQEGVTSRKGNPFNEKTIRNMLQNPKYKGWYCGNKSQSLDYRTKKKIFLSEDEWVTYPDPDIPAIVPEELWDRANTLFKLRSSQAKNHQKGASYHNRYPYSGKIICEEHNECYHRKVQKNKTGEREVWQCRVYHQRGADACKSPLLSTAELDRVMADIFNEIVENKEAIIERLLELIRSVPEEVNYQRERDRLEQEETAICRKKDRLLELSVQGALSTGEFKERNDGFNAQLSSLAQRKAALDEEEKTSRQAANQLAKIKAVLEETLSFQNSVDSELVSTILDHILVKKGSTKERVNLEIFLRVGESKTVTLQRVEKTSPVSNRSLQYAPPVSDCAR